MKAYSRVKATVSLDAVLHNFEAMKNNLKEGTRIIAVIKADGYGHGAIPIARLMESKEYIWGFAVATAEEALELRKAGIAKPILILGYVFPEYYRKLIQEEVRLTVFRWDVACEINEVAAGLGKKAYIHLALDTGMTRIGFPDTRESVETIRKIAESDWLVTEGLFTHFARADETDKAPAYVQLQRYQDFVSWLEETGISIPVKHCSNSAGILRFRKLIWMRCGRVLRSTDLSIVTGGTGYRAFAAGNGTEKPYCAYKNSRSRCGSQLRRNLCDKRQNSDRYNPFGIRRRIFQRAVQSGLCADSWKSGSDSGTCMYGSVYGGYHRNPGSSHGR